MSLRHIVRYGAIYGWLWISVSHCAPSLATMQPARLVPPKHVELDIATDVTWTSGQLNTAVSDFKDLLETETDFTPDEVRTLAQSASVLLVQPPSLGTQLKLSYGISRRFEVSAKTSVNTLRGGLRFQFLRVKPGFYGVLGAGIGTYLYGLPINRFTDQADFHKYNRTEFDFPLHFGYSARAIHLWGGPKLVYSRYDTDARICLTEEPVGSCSEPLDISVDGSLRHIVGQLGVAVGYRRFWFAFELTVGQAKVVADLGIDTSVLDETSSFERSGLVISPAVGVIAWF